MKANFSPRFLRPAAAGFLLFLRIFPGPCQENTAKVTDIPLFTWDLLWTGSWYNAVRIQDEEFPETEELFTGGTIYNRANLALGLPRQDLLFRFLATDKRSLPFKEDDNKAGFNPGLGIYHTRSGSRFLLGVQSEYGLPARVRNVWSRSVPFMESRSPSSRDLKAEPSAKDVNEGYLYLAMPRELLPGYGAYASAALDADMNPALGTGAEFSRGVMELRLDGFYTQKDLPIKEAASWFSPSPPLPERDYRIFALGAVFSTPEIAFATDWAWSHMYAWGQGVYGNFALRLGSRPWRFSLAGDGAGSRFVDRSGATVGSGFRLAARGEHFWPRSGLLRFQTTFRSPALGDHFDRAFISAYYRPSAPTAKERRENRYPLRFSRASLSFNRDARKPEKTTDTLDGLLGLEFSPLTAVFSCSLHSLSTLDADHISLFQVPVFQTFESLKLAGELGWNPGIFSLRTRLGYTVKAEKDNVFEFSLSGSVKPGKWGRVAFRIASADFPQKWNYTLSWRLEAQRP